MYAISKPIPDRGECLTPELKRFFLKHAKIYKLFKKMIKH